MYWRSREVARILEGVIVLSDTDNAMPTMAMVLPEVVQPKGHEVNQGWFFVSILFQEIS